MTQDNWQAAPFLEKVLGIVSGVIYVFNQKTQSNEYTNRSLADLLGYTTVEAQEMGEALFVRLCHPDDLAKVGDHFSKIQSLPDDTVVSIEYRMRHKDGHWVWLLSYDSVFQRESDGSVLSHIGVATDISEQKEAEKQALASKHRSELATREQTRVNDLLMQIMNTAQSAIVALSTDGAVLSINSAGRHFLGGSNALTPFKWPTDIRFIDSETLQPIIVGKSPIRRSLAGASLNGEIYLMSRGEGTEGRYVRVSSAPVAADQSAVNCVLIMDDVSEQEKHRQQIERTSRLDALGQLTGGIAHDFNNLLATVQYALELAQTADAESRHDYLETAKRSVERGSDLTKRLLAFAKQQPGASSSNDVSDVILDFRKLCTPLIEKVIEVDYVTSDDSLWVYCDAAQLENALLNLMLNARDAILGSGVGDKVIVSVRAMNEIDFITAENGVQPDTYVAKKLSAEQSRDQQRSDNAAFRYIEFAVTDNGPGMSEEVKRRAIDPFFTTKEKNAGTGLGLSMVYGFIEQSGGELRIYSEPEQGTTIRMLLPRGTAAGGREKRLVRDALQSGQGERILIVEDEVRLAIVLCDLVKALGYQVETASNGSEALAFFDDGEEFDLVISDIVMPGGLSGFELAEAIRKKKPEIPLIYMSGYTSYSDQDMGKVKAAMLQKPCPPHEMAAAICKALSER